MTNMATYRIAGASDSCFCQRAKVRHLPPLLAVKQIKIFWRCCQKINVLYHAIAKRKKPTLLKIQNGLPNFSHNPTRLTCDLKCDPVCKNQDEVFSDSFIFFNHYFLHLLGQKGDGSNKK